MAVRCQWVCVVPRERLGLEGSKSPVAPVAGGNRGLGERRWIDMRRGLRFGDVFLARSRR